MMTLADAIIAEDSELIREALSYQQDLNHIDEYGFTPLIEAAIADNIEIANLLIQAGANVNFPDATGGTALHWATENNNLPFCRLLLRYGANPNAYNFSGQPLLVMPLLRQQSELKNFLIENGADLEFAQDFINTKLMGHMFELVGTANIISPNNQYVEVDFEGFFLEVTLGIVADSLMHFKNHFAARQMRRYGNLSQTIVETIQRGAQLTKFQQYRVDTNRYKNEIEKLMKVEPLLLPIGYEGHAITFIKLGNILVKCDRRETSRMYDNIMFYQIGNVDQFTLEFTKYLLYEKQTDEFINEELAHILQLKPITELKVPAQISGNCSWANVEACIPVLHFVMSTFNEDFQNKILQYKSAAIKYFEHWREWNKDRTLHFCLQTIKSADSIRSICKAEILAAILFQCCNNIDIINKERIEIILNVLMQPEFEYLLQNYIKSYSYEDSGEEGKHFLKLLRDHGYKPSRS